MSTSRILSCKSGISALTFDPPYSGLNDNIFRQEGVNRDVRATYKASKQQISGFLRDRCLLLDPASA